MPERCGVRVYVRSRCVVSDARVLRFRMPVGPAPLGVTYIPVTRVELVRRWRLNDDQGEGLRHARRFAEATGQPLQVVDLGRVNPILRLVRWALLGGRALPVVVIKGSCAWRTVRGDSGTASALRA